MQNAVDACDFIECFKLNSNSTNDIICEEIIKKALKIKIDKNYLSEMKKIFHQFEEKEKDKINLMSPTKSMGISSMQIGSTKIEIPTIFIKNKFCVNEKKKMIIEIIPEFPDLEIENDLEKIKIKWEMNSFSNEIEVNNLDKSS